MTMPQQKKLNLGLLKGVLLCARYRKLPAAEKQEISRRRLEALLSYARANSPYYQELYRGLPEHMALSDLPPVNKQALMARFDGWVTDRDVKFSDVQTFMKDLDNVGRKFRKRWLVFSTSGSTGDPLILLADNTTNNVMGAINTTRAFSDPNTLKKLFARGGRSIGVFATGGFYLSNGSIRSRLIAMPWKKRQMALSSALLPIPQIVDQLNAFQPAMLGGYPSHLELLMRSRQAAGCIFRRWSS